MLDMGLDGVLSNLQVSCDFLIRLPLDKEAQYLHFTLGQRLSLFRYPYFANQVGRRLGRELDLPGGSSLDSSAQFGGLCVLEEVTNRPSPHRTNHCPAF